MVEAGDNQPEVYSSKCLSAYLDDHSGICSSGDRIQLHRNGNDIQYWSRRGIEHGQHTGFSVMDAVVKKQLKHDRCILDGEMIVWNKAR